MTNAADLASQVEVHQYRGAVHPAVHSLDIQDYLRRVTLGLSRRDKQNPEHVKRDNDLVKAGVMDPQSLVEAYKPTRGNSLLVEVHGPDGRLKAVRHSHNLRRNAGGLWEVQALSGGGDGTGANQTAYQVQGSTTTALTGTTLTTTYTAASATEWVGHIVTVFGTTNTVMTYGVILSHTTGANMVVTVDQWYSVATTGSGAIASASAAPPAAGTTPTGGTLYWQIGPGQAPQNWIALSNDATAITPDTATFGTEISANGLSRALALYAYSTQATAANGTNATNSTTYTLQHIWTATGTQSCQKAATFNAAGNGNGINGFLNTFTLATLASSDQVTLTWTFTD